MCHRVVLTTRLEDACAASCGCYGPARQEIVFGGNLSLSVNVQEGDTIVNRLYRLLAYLDATYPLEGWDAFRDDNDGTPEFTDIDWDSIVGSGHSQGAGNDMVMSKVDAVDLLVLFGIDPKAQSSTVARSTTAARPTPIPRSRRPADPPAPTDPRSSSVRKRWVLPLAWEKAWGA